VEAAVAPAPVAAVEVVVAAEPLALGVEPAAAAVAAEPSSNTQ